MNLNFHMPQKQKLYDSNQQTKTINKEINKLSNKT